MARQTQGQQARKIVAKVERKFKEVKPLHDRMDEDYRDWRMDPWEPDPESGVSQEDAYNTNGLRVLADKVEMTLAASERIIRIANDASDEARRFANQNTERLAVGLARMADSRLEARMKPPVQSQLGWMAPVRGGYAACKALLRKDEQGETVADIQPLDPRYLVMQLGDDEPIWGCYKLAQTRADIRDRYTNFKFGDESEDAGEDDEEVEVVYEYYFRENRPSRVDPENTTRRYMRAVIIADKFAQKPEDTNSLRFPLIVRAIGSNPGVPPITLENVAGEETRIEGIADFGESVFAPVRQIKDYLNRVTSYNMALTARAVDQSYKYRSADGSKQLEDNPMQKGMGIAVGQNEDIEPIELSRTTHDAQLLLQSASRDFNNGGFPPQALGMLDLPLSGNALRILGRSMKEKIERFREPVQSCVQGALQHLIEQYETGSFRPVKVFGRTHDGRSFSGPIRPNDRQVEEGMEDFILPEDIEGHGPLEVELLPELPEDSLEKWQTAIMASQATASGEPMLSNQYIRDRMLKIQDADQETDRIYTQMGRVATPVMQMLNMWESAVKEGDETTAAFYRDQAQKLITQQNMEHMARVMQFMQAFQQNPMQAAAQGMGNGQTSPNGGTMQGQGGSPRNPRNGIAPEAMGQSGQPGVSTAPSPDAGANTTAARPGAQNDMDQRLASVGLVRARR